MEELWKDIYGFEGLYQISNLGRVKSFPRNKTKGGIMQQMKDKYGYLIISLCKDGKTKNYKIHRLVALHFIPNENLFKTQINHKDENKENNNVDNLEWCTPEYNNNYGTHNERVAKSHINHQNMSKQVNQYDLAGNFIKTFPSTHEIQRELGFNRGNISQCCNGKLKTANGFIWKYA